MSAGKATKHAAGWRLCVANEPSKQASSTALLPSFSLPLPPSLPSSLPLPCKPWDVKQCTSEASHGGGGDDDARISPTVAVSFMPHSRHNSQAVILQQQPTAGPCAPASSYKQTIGPPAPSSSTTAPHHNSFASTAIRKVIDNRGCQCMCCNTLPTTTRSEWMRESVTEGLTACCQIEPQMDH